MKLFHYTIVLGALAILLLFMLYPLSLVLDASLRVNGTGTITLANYAKIFASRYYVGSILNSGRRTALAEAQLFDSADRLLAHATSSCMLFPVPGA